MEVPKTELFSVLQEFNPWWQGQALADLPDWERSATRQVWDWVRDTENRRSLLLSGARQVGKTTIFRQTIRKLIASGFSSGDVLYATFDHPLLKLAGLQRTLQAWDELYPATPGGQRLLFLDEIQYVPDWQTWLKHQVDFQRTHRVAVTGSADPLHGGSVESGVGRWETIPLPTLSFAEYLRLRQVQVPENLPPLKSLRSLFSWTPAEFARVAKLAQPLTAHFHEYLLRGGFPEPAMVSDLTRCQRLLREDIVDKVLKRDMTALYGVRRVLEVEKIFLYLCYHDGGILDIPTLTQQLEGVNKQTALNFLALFESTHLIYRLKPYGYGKEVLRGRDKVYLADAALPGAVLLLGRKLLQDPQRLGAAVETAFFKHVYTRYYGQTPRFSYWQDKRNRDLEVDLIAELGDRLVPFEVKYQDAEVTIKRLKGMRLFLEERKVQQGYVITQRWDDFKVLDVTSARTGQEQAKLDAQILSIPAPLACYWLSA
ncbi:MAG TPA: ATP-binding protein [Rubrivivax sp.]|nr:ATP-binding protein [Rubrivivax sp.]